MKKENKDGHNKDDHNKDDHNKDDRVFKDAFDRHMLSLFLALF